MIKDMKLIKEMIKQTQDRYKSYLDQRRHYLEFSFGYKEFVRINPYKHIMRFGKIGKSQLRFIRPFEVFERVGKVAYWFDLLVSMDGIHNVFHMSLFHKYIDDPNHVLRVNDV